MSAIETPIVTSGLLFIGDPHIASRAPGRRTDAKFYETVADKLGQAAQIANQGNLQAIITGDLFDKGRDSSPEMLGALFRALRKFRHTVWCLGGNHDLEETRLTERDTLSAVRDTGLLRILDPVMDPTLTLQCGDLRVLVGGTPYGQEIPKDVHNLMAQKEFPDLVIWVTHADIRFRQSYPGAIEPFPIKGCTMVVNGHMHDQQPSVQAGETLWVNPGNITRLSIDFMDYQPGVLSWTPLGGLHRHPLKVAPGSEVFDLRGRLTSASTDTGSLGTLPEFVRMLISESHEQLGSGKTRLAEELQETALELKTPVSAVNILLHLLGESEVLTLQETEVLPETDLL